MCVQLVNAQIVEYNESQVLTALRAGGDSNEGRFIPIRIKHYLGYNTQNKAGVAAFGLEGKGVKRG